MADAPSAVAESPDPFTLDQLRVLVRVAEDGSFSAAARRLGRVQSAVSQSMAVLEEHLGVRLWDRAAKVPALTDAGRAVLASARRVLADADALRGLAAGLREGLEPSVRLCIDALFPLHALVDLCASFAREFPAVDLRLDTQTLSAVSARVLDGSATLGVASPRGLLRGLTVHPLARIAMVPVVAPGHPLASIEGPVPRARLEEHVQIVLGERQEPGVEDQAVISDRTWRIAELSTKRALLHAGLGWGNLPEHVAREDLDAGRLVRIRPEGWGDDEHVLLLSAVHRPDAALGPAHRWVLESLTALCERDASRSA